MANVTFEKISPVSGRIQLALTKDEISSKLTEALKQERKRVNIKGFRKGKTPVSALRKLMGNQVLGPMLDREIQSALFGFIEEEKLDLIFSPMPVEDGSEPTLTAQNIQDLDLTYEVALKPEFELKMPTEKVTKYVLDTNDEFLDEQVERMRKQLGENKEIEDGKVEETDIVDVTFQEVDGELTNSTKLYVDTLSAAGKKKFIGKKPGATVKAIDLLKLEENGDDKYAKKYLLEVEDEELDLSGKKFTATINKISRIEPAELDEDFYTKFDPTGEVKDEAALRAKIAEDNASGFNQQGVGMANFGIQKQLVESHDFELPLELMKKLHKEDGEDSFDLFERGVRWMLIRNAFAAEKEIQLEYEDIKAEATASLLQMLGGQRPDFLTDDFIENYVQNMLKDEEQREQLATNAMEKKIMAALREEVTFDEQAIDADRFNEVIKEFNEANK